MNGGNQLLDEMRIQLRNFETGHLHTVYIDVYDTSLSRKWYAALNDLLANKNHLEKNYCFLGFAQAPRSGKYILDQVNHSIDAINLADIGYRIDDNFTLENSLLSGEIGSGMPGLKLIHERFNTLHRYFEDLQGTSGRDGFLAQYYLRADPQTRWHIRQLNLLCHEFESWALSNRKQYEAPEWQRPSQLMCYLNAPRFEITDEDLDSFGMDALVKDFGGVTVGVNKAVGKHHYEVFCDEGDNYDRATDTSITTVLRAQSQAAGDFDIEWARGTRNYDFQVKHLEEFRKWLIKNDWDPEDPQLTLGHPKVAQVNLAKSFGVDDPEYVWELLLNHLDVYSVQTSEQHAEYPYHWSDAHYMDQQVEALYGRQEHEMV